jgi:catechol 2,3-dioxygenase-like lactoylglutathione lyase family enzyme
MVFIVPSSTEPITTSRGGLQGPSREAAAFTGGGSMQNPDAFDSTGRNKMKIYGMQHIGFTVPDLDEAVEFFTTVFGAIECVATGKIEADDEYMRRRLGVPGNTRIEDIRFLRVGNGTNIELFHYSGDAEPGAPLKRNSQPGGFHLGFQVDDCMAAAERLREMDVTVLDGPTYVDHGPLEGLTWCYLQAPWGQFLEIISVDGQLAAERAGNPLQWSPVTNQ